MFTRKRAIKIGIAFVAILPLACQAFGAALAQQLPSAGVSMPGDIWDYARNAGPFGAALMWWMWQRADNERRELQKERDGLLERVLNGMNSCTVAITDTRKLLEDVVRSGIQK